MRWALEAAMPVQAASRTGPREADRAECAAVPATKGERHPRDYALRLFVAARAEFALAAALRRARCARCDTSPP